MTPELLELLTDSERAAHARLTLDRATYAVENGAADPTCASCGVPVHVRAGCDFEPGEDVCDSCAHLRNATNAANLRAALTTIATLRDHLRKQQEAFIAGLELAQRTSDAESAELRARLTTGIGLPLGVKDRNGNPVHIGDTLAFAGWEWDRATPNAPDHIYTVEYRRGDILVCGTVSDIPTFCRVVKRWDEKAADAAVKGAT